MTNENNNSKLINQGNVKKELEIENFSRQIAKEDN
jgi:hypothetical protein